MPWQVKPGVCIVGQSDVLLSNDDVRLSSFKLVEAPPAATCIPLSPVRGGRLKPTFTVNFGAAPTKMGATPSASTATPAASGVSGAHAFCAHPDMANDASTSGRPVRVLRTPQDRVPVSCSRCLKTVGSARREPPAESEQGGRAAAGAFRDIRLLKHCVVFATRAARPAAATDTGPPRTRAAAQAARLRPPTGASTHPQTVVEDKGTSAARALLTRSVGWSCNKFIVTASEGDTPVGMAPPEPLLIWIVNSHVKLAAGSIDPPGKSGTTAPWLGATLPSGLGPGCDALKRSVPVGGADVLLQAQLVLQTRGPRR